MRRLFRARAGLVVTVLLAAAVLVPAVAIAAGGSFWDDDASIFEADIEWMAAAGVTRGCNPPVNDRFCPNDPVTRGQMAAFMHRFADYVAVDLVQTQGCGRSYPTRSSPDGFAWDWTCTMTIATPVPGSIAMHGSASLDNVNTATDELSFCEFQIGGALARWSLRTVHLPWVATGGVEHEICSTDTWVEVPAGTHTVTFRVQLSAGARLSPAAATVTFTPAAG
jgi:hypothetical protein